MPDSRLIRIAVLLAAGAVLLPAPDASALCDGAPAVSGPQTIEVAGMRRSFVARFPAGYDGRAAAPVVFAFHPFGMNSQYMQGRVPLQRAWPEAIAVYPDGSPGEGNPAPSWQGRRGDRGDRDLQFFDAMLGWLDARACIDRARVFVMGYSNGAAFANLLGCERSGAIAGVAVAAGRLGCDPAAARPVVISHGLQDRTIGYEQAVAASKAWAQRNACTAPPKTGVPGCSTAEGCGAPTVLCTYAGGHEYDLPFTAMFAKFFKEAGESH